MGGHTFQGPQSLVFLFRVKALAQALTRLPLWQLHLLPLGYKNLPHLVLVRYPPMQNSCRLSLRRHLPLSEYELNPPPSSLPAFVQTNQSKRLLPRCLR